MSLTDSDATNLARLLGALQRYLPLSADEDYLRLASTWYAVARAGTRLGANEAGAVDLPTAQRHLHAVMRAAEPRFNRTGRWEETLSETNLGALQEGDKGLLLSTSPSLQASYLMLSEAVRSLTDSLYAQLTDRLIWGVPAAFLLLRKDTFVCGELYFNADSIAFVPLAPAIKFPNTMLDGTRWISRPIGGLAAKAPSSQARLATLQDVARKLSIQMGMSALEKFVHNIDGADIPSNSYLHISRGAIKDVRLDSSAIFVERDDDTVMFGSTAVHFTQEETRRNIDAWKAKDLASIGESLYVSTTIAPKRLLDGLLSGRTYDAGEIAEFLEQDINRRTLYGLYLGLTPEEKETFRLRAAESADQLLAPLDDLQFMAGLQALGNTETSNCFIASEIFSDRAPEVVVLRRFRDETLARTWLGREFVREYYRYGPAAAAALRTRGTLKRVLSIILRAVVWIIIVTRR